MLFPKHIFNCLRRIIKCYSKLLSNSNNLLMKCYLPEALDFAFIYCAITKIHSLYSISILCQPNQIITAFFKLLSSIQTKHITPFLSTLKTTTAIWSYDINMPRYFFQSYLFCFLFHVREGSVHFTICLYVFTTSHSWGLGTICVQRTFFMTESTNGSKDAFLKVILCLNS